MTPKENFIGIIVLIILVTAVTSVVVLMDTGETEGTTGDKSNVVVGFADYESLHDFNKTASYGTNISDDIDSLTTKLTTKFKVDNPLQVASLPLAFVSSAWDAILIIMKGYINLNLMVIDLAAILYIPAWVATFAVAILNIILIFSIISLIFGRDF